MYNNRGFTEKKNIFKPSHIRKMYEQNKNNKTKNKCNFFDTRNLNN